MKYYSHNQMKEVNKEFTPKFINELKELLVERIVDNMSTKDLEEYVTDNLDEYYDGLTDSQFIIEAQNYWDDSFDDVIEEIEEFAELEEESKEPDVTDFFDFVGNGSIGVRLFWR